MLEGRGHLVEGLVEFDPVTGRYVIRTTDGDGNSLVFDPTEALSAMKGEEVRFVLVPLPTIVMLEELQQRLEAAGEAIEVIDSRGIELHPQGGKKSN